MRKKSATKNEIIQWWTSLNYEDIQQEPEELIRQAAEKFAVPEEIMRKQIADWEAGKGGK